MEVRSATNSWKAGVRSHLPMAARGSPVGMMGCESFRWVGETIVAEKLDDLRTLDSLLREGIGILSEAGIQNAGNEAAWILEFALGVTRLTLQLDGRRRVEPKDSDRVRTLFARRAAHEPLQYILGTQEFWGLEFVVDPSVLIPRQETELLVEEVVHARLPTSAPVIADVGTGSGCVAVALARALPDTLLYATDRSPAALRVARQNAARHHVADRVVFLYGDLLVPLREAGLQGRLAAIVSNPPYIPDDEFPGLPPEVRAFEPSLALAGGRDGLAAHRRLLREAPEFLVPGGLLALEVGQGQAGTLCRIAGKHREYGPAVARRDQAGIERVVCLQKTVMSDA